MKFKILTLITLPRALLCYQLLRQGTMLLISILLTKSQLSTAAIGQYEQVWFLGGALSFFWMIGLQQGLLNYFPRVAVEAQARLVTLAVLVYFLISALLVGSIAVFPKALLSVFSGQYDLPFGAISLWFLFLYLPGLLTDTLYVLLNRPRELFVFGILSFGLQLLVVLVPAFMNWGTATIVQGLLGLSLAKALWLLGMAWRFGQGFWHWEHFTNWWNASFYLMIYSAIGGYITVFNAWIVNWYYGGDELQFALFRYGARELPVSLALVGGLNALILQKAAADLPAAMPEIRQRSTRLMHFLMPFTILLLLTSKWWFPFLFNTNFIASLPVFNTFLLLVISRVVFSFPILNALRDKKIAIIGACSEAAFNVIACLILVPIWGLLGIAVANFLAYGLEKLIYGIHLYRRYQIPLQTYLNVSLWLMYSLGLILAWITQII